MTHGPDWTIYIFNDKTKRVYTSSLQDWLASCKKREIAGRFEGATWKRGNKNIALAGVRAYEFLMDKPPPARTSSASLSGTTKSYNPLQQASFWVASDIRTPPQISTILSRLYGVPDCQRVPLRLVIKEIGKDQSTAVDTLKISHVAVPATVFTVPRDYEPAQTDTAVFIDKQTEDALKEMLQDMDNPSQKQNP
jgi:hypothetical protein